jgi:putative transposase
VKDDSAVIDKRNKLVESKPRRGFPYFVGKIRNEGLPWNKKRVKRVYNLLQLNLTRMHRRSLPERLRQALAAPAKANLCESIDLHATSY